MTALAKLLQWEETFDGSGQPNGFSAETNFGLAYRIDQYFGSDSYGWNVLLGNVWLADCDDPNAAKAKAQEDFEFRIWACVAHAQEVPAGWRWRYANEASDVWRVVPTRPDETINPPLVIEPLFASPQQSSSMPSAQPAATSGDGTTTALAGAREGTPAADIDELVSRITPENIHDDVFVDHPQKADKSTLTGIAVSQEQAPSGDTNGVVDNSAADRRPNLADQPSAQPRQGVSHANSPDDVANHISWAARLRAASDDDSIHGLRLIMRKIASELEGSLHLQEEGVVMPRELTDEHADAALRTTASWLDIKGSGLTVNREKMKARYRALVKFIEGAR